MGPLLPGVPVTLCCELVQLVTWGIGLGTYEVQVQGSLAKRYSSNGKLGSSPLPLLLLLWKA